jgi:hypothetical protein
MTTGQKAQQTVKIVDSKCAAKMLQYAATNGIRCDLRPNAKWLQLRTSDPNIPFGACQTTFPPRPAEHWVKCEERNHWYRMHDPAEFRALHNELENRPRAFQTVLDKTSRTLTIKTFPEVVAHDTWLRIEVSGHPMESLFRFACPCLNSRPTLC